MCSQKTEVTLQEAQESLVKATEQLASIFYNLPARPSRQKLQRQIINILDELDGAKDYLYQQA
jgi:hypothetical protein